MTKITIRSATLNDLDAITEIYNQAILNTTATFDTTPKTLEEQKTWFSRHGPQHPVLVAREDGPVIGWAALSEWSNRCAYSGTAEISFYVHEDCQGRGIGRKLAEATVCAGRDTGLHTLIARIAQGNEASVHIAESLGFNHIGVMKEVGQKFGKLLDVYLMQKIYDTPS